MWHIRTANLESAIKTHVVIINQNISSNALGRSLSMAMVAREIGDTKVLSFGHGKIWAGSSQFDIPVLRLSQKWKTDLDAELSRHEGCRTVIWLSKGLEPLSRVAAHVRQRHPQAVILLDLDDDDAGLAEAFRKTSWINYLKLSWIRRGNPWRIRRSQNFIASIADGFTFSTNALASVYPDSYEPRARVPHVRSLITGSREREQRKGRELRFGCFGTLRPHKGSQMLLDIMRSDRSLTLVTFKNCGLGSPLPSDVNWVEIDGATPLQKAYDAIDVAVIPITDVGPGAQYQLPAKIVDAMRSNVPIVATVTPAIEEIAGGVITPLNVGQSLDDIKAAIRGAARGGRSHAVELRFRELLTPQAAAREVSALLERSS